MNRERKLMINENDFFPLLVFFYSLFLHLHSFKQKEKPLILPQKLSAVYMCGRPVNTVLVSRKRKFISILHVGF